MRFSLASKVKLSSSQVCFVLFDSCDFVAPPRLPSKQKGSTYSHEKILARAVRLERRAPANKFKLEAITFELTPSDVFIFSFVTS